MPPALVTRTFEPANAEQFDEGERGNDAKTGIAGNELDAINNQARLPCKAPGVICGVGAVMRREHVFAAPALDHIRHYALQSLWNHPGDTDLIVVGVWSVIQKDAARAEDPCYLAKLPLGVIEMLDDHVRRDQVEALRLEWEGAYVASAPKGKGGVATHRLEVVIQAHDDAGESTVSINADDSIGFRNLKSYSSAGDFEGHLTYGLGLQVAPNSDQVLLVRAGELTKPDGAGGMFYVVYVDIQTG